MKQSGAGRCAVACVLGLAASPAGARTDSPSLSTTPSWRVQVDYFGEVTAAAAGDVNGDGYGDVIVGADGEALAPSVPGRVLLFYGSATGLPSAPGWLAQDIPGSEFGRHVASAGDINGDGYDDVVVGAPGRLIPPPGGGDAHAPRAHLYLGSPTGLSGTTWAGEATYRGCGNVAGAGDVNGDGFDDVIQGDCGSQVHGMPWGRAWVFAGSAAGLAGAPSWTIVGEQANAFFASRVAPAGDVNADGYDDVVVGASGYDGGEVNEGKAYLYLGSAAGLSSAPAWTAEGNRVAFAFGASVASAGDLNGDGYDDVIVGAPGRVVPQIEYGAAFVYYGSAAGLSPTPAWSASRDVPYFGWGAASAGDLDGDGYADVVVGAPWCSTKFGPNGHAYVFGGTAAGLPSAATWVSTTSIYRMCFPEVVATAGDVNGDGLSDLLLAGKENFDSQSGVLAEVYHGVRPATKFYAVPPCRVVDTRNPGEGPALGANTLRAFPVRGLCGVPADALAVAANVTAVNATDLGDLRVFPAGTATPLASTINFGAGQTRANSAIVRIGTDGRLGVRCDMPEGSAGQVHLVIDVSGYFRP